MLSAVNGDPRSGQDHDHVDQLLQLFPGDPVEDAAADEAADGQTGQPPEGGDGDSLWHQSRHGADGQQVDVVEDEITLQRSHVRLFIVDDGDEIENHGRAVDGKQAAAQTGDDAGDTGVSCGAGTDPSGGQ